MRLSNLHLASVPVLVLLFLSATSVQAQPWVPLELAKARLKEAQDEFNARFEAFQTGRDGMPEFLYFSGQQLIEAQLALYDERSDRLKALEEHWRRYRKLEEINQARYDSGRTTVQDLAQSKVKRIEAEILLAKVLVADVPPADQPLAEDELAALWNSLADQETIKAYKAMAGLLAVPQQALAHARKRLQPAAQVTDETLAKLIAALDSDQFEVRQKAERELEAIGPQALPFLKKALAGKPPPEVSERLKRIIGKVEPQDTAPEVLGPRRAAELLRLMNRPEARQILQALAEGAPGANITAEARAALKQPVR
jgi:hypothetical protein